MNLAARTRLAAEILSDYVQVRRGLRRATLPEVLAELRAVPPQPMALGAGDADGLRLARAVVRTLSPLPLDSRCLMRSLVLLRGLARRGVAASLVIAVRPQDSGPLGAHAWVEADGRALLAPAGMQGDRLVTL